MAIRLRLIIGLSCVASLGVLAQSSSSARVERLDSLILERTGCLGPCPAYRLAIHSSGLVRFQSRNPDDAGRTASDSGGARALARLAREVARVHFLDLPAIEVGKAPFCPMIMTDASTISVAIFGPSVSRGRRYYEGCKGEASHRRATRSALARLGSLADSVDAIAGASRWIRPGSCCGG